MSETQDKVDAVTAQLTKVEGEVVGSHDSLAAEIQSLKDQLANIPGAEVVDVSGLEAVAARLDALNPDAEPPVEEPPVEEPPVENPPVEEPPVGDTPAEPTE